MTTYACKPTPYLTPEDQHAFLDWTHLSPVYDRTKECPVCKGFGGWNLRVNAYSMPPGYADTAENRHQQVHFRTMCGHCNGNGYVTPEESCKGHKWSFLKNLGNCYNRYKCVHCVKTEDVDSSD